MTSKKLFFYFLLVFSLLAFSCASKPKVAPDNVNDFISEENEAAQKENFNEDSETDMAAEESDSSEETSDSTETTNEPEEISESGEDITSEEIYEPEEERIDADELDVLPETEDFFDDLENEQTLEEELVVIEDTESEPENATNENETIVSENQEPEDISLTESSQTENNEKSFEKVESAESEDIDSDVANENSLEETIETEELDEQKNEPEQTVIEPSRSITIGKNQLIDIVYPGKGWIYQGNIDSDGNIDSKNKNFIFGGRKLGGQDQSFTLRSRQPGKYLLHFYKDDLLTGNYIDDYLEVIVEDRPAETSDHITVPSYAEIVPPKISITAEKVKEQQKKQKNEESEKIDFQKETKTTGTNKKTEINSEKKSANVTNITSEKDENVSTTVQTTESAPNSASPVVKNTIPSVSSRKINADSSDKKEASLYSDSQLEKLDEDNLLETAEKLYSAKDFEQALRVITKFFEKASKNMDKGLYLQGQILEEKSPVQNIKDAVESYDLLVKNHPDSSLSDKAKKRSIYLKRFYINIR